MKQGDLPMKKDYLVIDFEFTQYRRPVGRPRGFFSEIIEIGALKLDKETLEATEKIEEFVKPHFYPKQAIESMEFCSITPSDMKKAVSFIEMIEKLSQIYVPHETWFVAWGKEDYKVLDTACSRHNIQNPILQEDYLDLAEVVKQIKGLAQTPGLVKTAIEMDVNEEGHWHAAYEDAVKASKILIKLLQEEKDIIGEMF